MTSENQENMSIEDLIQQENYAIKGNPNAPITKEARVYRKNDNGSEMRIYSIRLTGNDITRLEARAKRQGLPPSALARGYILEKLDDQEPAATISNIVQTLENAAHALSNLDKKHATG